MLKLNKNDEVIIFRSAGIGDFLVVLPFINYLLNIVCIPEENINFVIINNQNINPLKLVFDNDRAIVKNSIVLNPGSIFSSIKNVKQKYKEKKFTKIIYLPFLNENFTSKLKKTISIKLIIGFFIKIQGLTYRKKSLEIGSQYLTYFEQLGLTNFKEYLDFKISNLVKFTDTEYKAINILNLDQSKKNIALYINSKLEMKIWPMDEYYKLILHLKNKYNCNIYLIGSMDDFEYNLNFISKFNILNIYNIAGKLSILETILLFDRLDLLVGNDGAPIHMASYTSCSILGIYTYKEEVSSWEPYKSNSFITYRKDVSCKHCYLEFCSNPICIKDLKFEDISSSIDILLEKKQTKQSIVVY